MYILLVLYASGVYMKTQSAHFLCSHCKSSDINESSPTMLLEINLLFYIINYYEIANQFRKKNRHSQSWETTNRILSLQCSVRNRKLNAFFQQLEKQFITLAMHLFHPGHLKEITFVNASTAQRAVFSPETTNYILECDLSLH